MYRLLKKSKVSSARLGRLETAHGAIQTPFFMPVATQGAVKHVSTEEMRRLKAPVLLANTYHLMLRPGEAAVKKFGGLHAFMDWDGTILTDSGGFQVFSLGKGGNALVKISNEGVRFRSYIDGSEHFLTPERALRIQSDLGVDIAVCLDECVALPAQRQELERSVQLTTEWAKRTVAALRAMPARRDRRALPLRRRSGQDAMPLLFAVIQGGLDRELRLRSLSELTAIGFDGYNIGGLSVGESPKEMYKVLDYLVPEMPADKPRYLMGVGYPENIVEAVRRGVDMFDCVIPTREGRHGRLFFFKKTGGNSKFEIRNSKFYNVVNINNSKFSGSQLPINTDSALPELRNYTLGYLHYLFKIKEPLGQRLASLNNLEFYISLMEKIRLSIKDGRI